MKKVEKIRKGKKIKKRGGGSVQGTPTYVIRRSL
jgi:hypothetical protein